MAIKTKPMTKSELRQHVESYRSFFVDWTDVGGEGFLRVSGPVAQQVWFENLRSGAYRPVTAISILVAKGGAMLHSFLDIRNREVLPREHELKLEMVCKAMSDQFIPSVISPLNAREVCRLCEEHAMPRISDAHSLSALNAYLGNIDSAREWIATSKRLTFERTDLQNWETDCVMATHTLEVAIESGNVKSVLDEIRRSEEARILRV